ELGFGHGDATQTDGLTLAPLAPELDRLGIAQGEFVGAWRSQRSPSTVIDVQGRTRTNAGTAQEPLRFGDTFASRQQVTIALERNLHEIVHRGGGRLA